MTLDRNYRSTQPILDASNAVIGLAAERFTKDLWTDRTSSQKPWLVTVRDEADEARYVVDRVLEQRENGIALKSQAVLFRSSSHSAQLELELARRDIPYVKFGGLKFLEAAHIKDVLSILRWVDNPRNRLAGFRAVQLLPGVGPATATKLLDAFDEAAGSKSVLEAFRMPAQAMADWKTLLPLIQALRASITNWPAELEGVIGWYERQLDRLYEDPVIRQGDLAQLQQVASGYASRERFLTEMTLDPPEATSDQAGASLGDDDYLTLSTIHSAKGQEWKVVQILSVVDGRIPSDRATGTPDEIEEERRLLYVAMTRAKEELHLIVPQRFFVRPQVVRDDRHLYAGRSRFIPEELTRLFECRGWPIAQPSGDAEATHGDVAVPLDLSARLRALFD